MIKPSLERLEALLERLEVLYSNNDLLLESLNHATQTVAEAKIRQAEAKADLESVRAAAIAAKQIQTTDHGSNQSLRDAHERDYLKVQCQAVELADKDLILHREHLDQVSREESRLRRAIQICDMQIRLLSMIDYRENFAVGEPIEAGER